MALKTDLPDGTNYGDGVKPEKKCFHRNKICPILYRTDTDNSYMNIIR